jgi:hypothetical protein
MLPPSPSGTVIDGLVDINDDGAVDDEDVNNVEGSWQQQRDLALASDLGGTHNDVSYSRAWG